MLKIFGVNLIGIAGFAGFAMMFYGLYIYQKPLAFFICGALLCGLAIIKS